VTQNTSWSPRLGPFPRHRLTAVAAGPRLQVPSYGGYHATWALGGYLAPVMLATAIASVSATRGLRATRPRT